MKIIAIDAERTQSIGRVVFKTDIKPNEEVLQRAKYRNHKFKLLDGLVEVSVSGGLSRAEITAFNEAFLKAEREIAAEREQAEKEHDDILADLSRRTGLPIE